ncbi:MAG: DUF362 domain-containing protein [Candidatus Heimdallarchaeota archaeon]
MSFFLDPPALFLLGMLLYIVKQERAWKPDRTFFVGAIIALAFLIVSPLLYLDVLSWPLPYTTGSKWMFHSDQTGILIEDVSIALVIIMFLFYPVWLILGYLVGRHFFKPRPLVVTPEIFTYTHVKSSREREPTHVVVKRGANKRQMVREALDELGGIKKYVKSGDSVLIKPNISGGNPEIPGSFTSLEVVETLVDLVREAGGVVTAVVDSDMIWTDFWPVAKAQGWKSWAKKLDVPLINLAETECATFDFGEGSTIRKAVVSKKLVNANVIISVPTMKTHLLTDVTLGLKNMYGTFPEPDKAKFHKKDIENVIAEVNKAFTPTLTIIDGSIGGEAFGPLSSKPVNFETIIASNDVVAADSVAAQLIGYDPSTIDHIQRAHDLKVGDASVRIDFAALPYKHEKDGKWERPDVKVTDFYNNMLEAALKVPGMQTMFNYLADFALYGTATLPVLEDLTPLIEEALNDILSACIRSGKVITGFFGKIARKLRRILRL